jgi:hypothetical protein
LSKFIANLHIHLGSINHMATSAIRAGTLHILYRTSCPHCHMISNIKNAWPDFISSATSQAPASVTL